MIKLTCFDKCLQDCNGVNCGDTAQPDTGMTRLQLTGSGQICDAPVSEEELLAQCQTTGMIMEDGEFVDDFVRESISQSGGQSMVADDQIQTAGCLDLKEDKEMLAQVLVVGPLVWVEEALVLVVVQITCRVVAPMARVAALMEAA